MKIEAKHSLIFWISSLLPLTFMNDDCWPANDALPRSSAVAELLTDTNIGSRADFKIASAPGEPCSPARSMLKWSYASRISISNSLGISALIIISRISFALFVKSLVLSTSILCRMSLIGCSSFASFKNWKNVSVVATNAGGTGNFALNISPRFAPLPPASCRSALDSSVNHATYLSPMLNSGGKII